MIYPRFVLSHRSNWNPTWPPPRSHVGCLLPFKFQNFRLWSYNIGSFKNHRCNFQKIFQLDLKIFIPQISKFYLFNFKISCKNSLLCYFRKNQFCFIREKQILYIFLSIIDIFSKNSYKKQSKFFIQIALIILNDFS